MSTTQEVAFIERIASTFAVPDDTFFRYGEGDNDTRLRSLEDTVDLILSFTTIADERARRRCVAFVKAVANKDLARRAVGDPNPLV